jgi:ABC-type transporter Mla MlaB component
MSGRPILLLESDEATTAALGSLLEADGFPVVTARSLFQAEELARKAGAALLLVNLHHEKRVLDPAEIEGLARVARCPVVTMSHRGAVDPVLYATRAHLFRPFDLESLLSAVRKHYQAGVSTLTPVPPQAASGDPLQVELRAGVLSLGGHLDERASLDTMMAPLQGHAGPALKVDCAGLRRVNSTGTRIWIEFMRALRKRGLELTLRALSPTLVAQAKLIDGVLAGCRVESFLCMTECPRCRRESHELVDTSTGALPEVTCACGATAVVADHTSAYDVLFAAAPPRPGQPRTFE